MGSEQLPHNADIVRLVNENEDDRNISRYPVSPQGRGPARMTREHISLRPEGPVGVEDAPGKALEEVGLVGADAEMV